MIGAGLLLAAAAALLTHPVAAAPPSEVVVVHLSGSLDSRLADLATTALSTASGDSAAALVVALDSRGGRAADAATIAAGLRSAPLPTVAWIASGAHADGVAAQLLGAVDVVASPALPASAPSAIQAPDLASALAALDGRSVLHGSRTWRLATAGASLRDVGLDGWGSFRQGLAEPDTAFLLLVLAIACLGLFAVHPANLLPLVAGGLAALGAVTGLLDLPAQWMGAAFIGLALLLFAADLAVPSHGVITAGGVALLIAGGAMLVDRTAYAGGVSAWLLGVCGALVVTAYAVLLPRLLAVRRMPVSEPLEELVGRVATVSEPLGPDGVVALGGTFWRARSVEGEVAAGERVIVVEAAGLRLTVASLPPSEAAETERTSQTPQPIA